MSIYCQFDVKNITKFLSPSISLLMHKIIHCILVNQSLEIEILDLTKCIFWIIILITHSWMDPCKFKSCPVWNASNSLFESGANFKWRFLKILNRFLGFFVDHEICASLFVVNFIWSSCTYTLCLLLVYSIINSHHMYVQSIQHQMHCSTSHRVLLQAKYLLSDYEIDPNISKVNDYGHWV